MISLSKVVGISFIVESLFCYVVVLERRGIIEAQPNLCLWWWQAKELAQCKATSKSVVEVFVGRSKMSLCDMLKQLMERTVCRRGQKMLVARRRVGGSAGRRDIAPGKWDV